MRILHVIDDLQLGGAERNLVSVLPAMPSHDHTVVHLLDDDAHASTLRAAGVRVEMVPARHPREAPRAVARLRALCDGMDVLHTQRWIADLLGRIAARGRTSVVTTVQTSPYEPSVIAAYPWKGRAIYRALWLADAALSKGTAERMVGVSDYVCEMIQKRLRVPAARTRRVYNSIEVAKFDRLAAPERERMREELGIASTDRAIVTVGHLVPLKGQATLVEAMPALLRLVPEALLLIVGDGIDRPRLEARSQALGVAQRVRFLGKRSDVPRLLGAVDLFALASRLEGLPLSVLEAMASGLPCVLSAIAPHVELAGHFAPAADGGGRMIVRDAAAASWADAIARFLLDGELAASFARRGREVVCSQFDARVTAPALEKVFLEAADSFAARRRRRGAAGAR